MIDEKTKQKAIEAVAEIHGIDCCPSSPPCSVFSAADDCAASPSGFGDPFDERFIYRRNYLPLVKTGIDSIAADLKDQKVTTVGEMDTLVVVKKLKKIGRVEVVSVGPAKEEKKDDKKK